MRADSHTDRQTDRQTDRHAYRSSSHPGLDWGAKYTEEKD